MLRLVIFLLPFLLASICPSSHGSDRAGVEKEKSAVAPVSGLIGWLLDRNRELHGIDFSEVILATTGKKVLAFDPRSEADERVMKALSAALDQATKQMNRAESPIQDAARINEVSSHVENLLRELL